MDGWVGGRRNVKITCMCVSERARYVRPFSGRRGIQICLPIYLPTYLPDYLFFSFVKRVVERWMGVEWRRNERDGVPQSSALVQGAKSRLVSGWGKGRQGKARQGKARQRKKREGRKEGKPAEKNLAGRLVGWWAGGLAVAFPSELPTYFVSILPCHVMSCHIYIPPRRTVHTLSTLSTKKNHKNHISSSILASFLPPSLPPFLPSFLLYYVYVHTAPFHSSQEARQLFPHHICIFIHPVSYSAAAFFL